MNADFKGLLESELGVHANVMVLADALDDYGHEEAAGLLRSLDDWLEPVILVRRRLRNPGLVEPECLRICLDGDWTWCLFHASAGHPHPRNAGNGYSYPAHTTTSMVTQHKSPELKQLMEWLALTGGEAKMEEQPGTWAVLQAVMQILWLHKATGSKAVTDEFYMLDLSR